MEHEQSQESSTYIDVGTAQKTFADARINFFDAIHMSSSSSAAQTMNVFIHKSDSFLYSNLLRQHPQMILCRMTIILAYDHDLCWKESPSALTVRDVSVNNKELQGGVRARNVSKMTLDVCCWLSYYVPLNCF